MGLMVAVEMGDGARVMGLDGAGGCVVSCCRLVAGRRRRWKEMRVPVVDGLDAVQKDGGSAAGDAELLWMGGRSWAMVAGASGWSGDGFGKGVTALAGASGQDACWSCCNRWRDGDRWLPNGNGGDEF
ncbi:hypothetical protein ACLOJK_029419 [Asimina triloba]